MACAQMWCLLMWGWRFQTFYSSNIGRKRNFCMVHLVYSEYFTKITLWDEIKVHMIRSLRSFSLNFLEFRRILNGLLNLIHLVVGFYWSVWNKIKSCEAVDKIPYLARLFFFLLQQVCNSRETSYVAPI